MQDPTKPLFEIRSTPQSGRAVFATSALPSGTLLLQSNDLALSVLFREYRREVCGQCFSYAHGRDLPVRDVSVGFAFCKESCQQKWKNEAGEVGVQAWTAVETLVRKRAKEDNEMVDVGLPRPTATAIEEAWEGVEVQAALIRIARQAECPDHGVGIGKVGKTDAHVQVPITKQHKRAIQNALQQPISPDVMSFCVSGLLSIFNTPLHLPNILALEADTTPYTNADDLKAFTRTYLHLLAILPTALLPLLTPTHLLLLSSRDSHNAFGIRSLEDEGSEFFGYGCWPTASYFNHSCNSSLLKTRIGRVWEFRASRDIGEGEELSITYLSKEERERDRQSRREVLKSNWGFECACVRCEEGDAS